MSRYLIVFIIFTGLIFAGIFYLKTNPDSNQPKGVGSSGLAIENDPSFAPLC